MYNLIFNPAAGHGRSQKQLDIVTEILDKKNIAYSVHKTEQPGHATEIAKALIAKGEKTIVAVGGDGTVAEVAKAVYGTGAALGIIPAGTGNDYRRAVGVPDEIEKSIDFILNGKPVACDAIECNGEVYLNIVSMGFDVEVVDRASKYKLFGSAAYTLAAIDRALFAKNLYANITIDGKTTRKNILLTAIGNGSHYGGGMNSLPTADITDGLLDICIIEATTSFKILSLLPKYMAGQHMDMDLVEMHKAKEITIELEDKALPINADGEILPPSKTLNVKILKGLINVIR
ncbi:MAG: diacylglycerol kinase family lipid kinase [Clostridia bacterium]|nr:diacylglycerol kinase family lipid kinase [Clostridia bacterium]